LLIIIIIGCLVACAGDNASQNSDSQEIDKKLQDIRGLLLPLKLPVFETNLPFVVILLPLILPLPARCC
jgi:hypothetical protein